MSGTIESRGMPACKTHELSGERLTATPTRQSSPLAMGCGSARHARDGRRVDGPSLHRSGDARTRRSRSSDMAFAVPIHRYRAHAGWPDPNRWAHPPIASFSRHGTPARSNERLGRHSVDELRTEALHQQHRWSRPSSRNARQGSLGCGARRSRSLGAVGRLGRRRQRPSRRSSPCSSSEGPVATALPLAASRMTTARKQ